MHTVKFIRAGRVVQAKDGEVLLDVAQRHGVHIDSSCGGNGSCHQCRVTVKRGQDNLRRDGEPASVRYESEGEPVFLACQGEVRGDLEVDPAPVHGAKTDHPVSTLAGWNAGRGGASLTVIDPGAFTGGEYQVNEDGAFSAGQGFEARQRDDANACVIGRDVGYAEALKAGVSHLDASLALDFAGRLLDLKTGRLETFPPNAFLGSHPHLPGAIDYVEWSPLKTRTLIATVGRQAPTGLSATGAMSCVVALIRAGMCSYDLQLSESRFTRRINGQLAAMIVGPDDEAQTQRGVIYKSENAVTLGQGQLNAIRDAGRMVADQLKERSGRLVTTGDFGTFVPAELIRALGIWDGAVEFVPHAAALGAARISCAKDMRPRH